MMHEAMRPGIAFRSSPRCRAKPNAHFRTLLDVRSRTSSSANAEYDGHFEHLAT